MAFQAGGNMKIHDFIGCLSMQERRRLASQISCSTGYLNQIACGHYFPTDDFVHRVYTSSLNRHLVPAKLRISRKDYEQHIEARREQRIKHD